MPDATPGSAPPAADKRRPAKVPHWTDDPVTDGILAVLAAGIQIWSTAYMWKLASWVYGSGWIGLVNVLFYDIAALLALRIAADRRWPSNVRNLGGWIAGACFAITFAGNMLSHHTLTNEGTVRPEYVAGMADAQKWLGDALGALPVILLVAVTLLELLRKRYRAEVLAYEAREAERRAELDRQAAARAEREAAERDAARVAAERAAAEAAEAERIARETADQRQDRDDTPNESNDSETADEDRQGPDRDDSGPVDPAVQVLAERYPAADGESKTEWARRIYRGEYARGEDPAGTVVDVVVGGNSLGRRVRAELRRAGERPNPRGKLAVV